MKAFKRFLTVVLSILLIGGIVSAITCTYLYNLNIKALWWSLIVGIFLINVVLGLCIFYDRKRPDETKASWLIIILLLPVVGWVLFFVYGYKQKCNFVDSDNNHAKLLHAIFSARKSIRIYSDTFFPSYDTFNALNFATYKDVKVEVLLTVQKTKSKQEYIEYKLEQLFDKRVHVYFTNLHDEKSFIIIDDSQILVCPKNFNFKSIYSDEQFKKSNDFDYFNSLWNNRLIRSSKFDYKQAIFSRAKRLKFSIINIFYSFL